MVRWESGDSRTFRALAGFDLYGYRDNTGKVTIGDTSIQIDEWPDEIVLGDDTYTFEYTQRGNFVEGKGTFENAIYV